MNYTRMPIEAESPEEYGYDNIKYNLSESSVTDLTLAEALGLSGDGASPSAAEALSKLVLLYTVHAGHADLRTAISKLYPERERPNPDDIIVTPGAVAALFMVNTALVGKEDHLVVHSPNYATNIHVPVNTIGAKVSFVDLTHENGFTSSWQDFAQKIQPNTKLLSLTSPHNPSGISQNNLLTDIVENVLPQAQHSNLFVLSDETYRFFVDFDICSAVSAPAAAAGAAQDHHARANYAESDRVIRIASLSKFCGLPGIRIGWIICRNAAFKTKMLAAKEQILISGSVLDEAVATIFLTSTLPKIIPTIKARVTANYTFFRQWCNSNKDILDVVDPGGASVVCFARVHGFDKSPFDLKEFHRMLLEDHSTFVGPGRWFSGYSDHYFRIGFGYPSLEQLSKGLENIKISVLAMREKAAKAN